MKQLLIKIIKNLFHKADYDKINEYFRNFKWDDVFTNRNANECWLKFWEIAKESIELYVTLRWQRKRKVPPWMTKRSCKVGSTKVFMEKIS